MSVAEPVTSDAEVASHYRLVSPAMERLFGRIPVVWTTFLSGPGRAGSFHQHCFGHYSHLSGEHVQHLVSIGAREFYSWFPVAQDPSRAHFARFLLEKNGGIESIQVKQAAAGVREVLEAKGFGSIPLLDGAGNVVLFVPVAEAPPFDLVRAWCHAIAREAIMLRPDLISADLNTQADKRVHPHVSSNAQGRFSIVPYSLRFTTGYVATPVRWDELDALDIRGVQVEGFAQRIVDAGEVFGDQLSRLPVRPLPKTTNVPAPIMQGRSGGNARGALIEATVDILSDGKARTVQEIFDAGTALGTIKGTAQILNSALLQYVQRCVARGRKPPFVQTFDRKYRLNETPDAWPDVPPPGPLKSADPTDEIIARLHATGTGDDPTAYEVAVCDAFAALGFLSTHVGGKGAPDGYADAPLGTLGYRVMLECKSGTAAKVSPDVFEASKFKDGYNAQYCALVGADPGSEQETLAEMKNHGVSLWSNDDLATALQHEFTLMEILPAFAPGVVASDVLPDILWERNHGCAKHALIVTQSIRSAGWATQTGAAQAGGAADAPVLTEDAAMLLVDQELLAQGCRVSCTREQVRDAFDWLTNPLTGIAVWTPDRGGIVIVRE